MKKIVALIMALAMVLSVSLQAFAEDAPGTAPAAYSAEGMCSVQLTVKDGAAVGGTLSTNASVQAVLSGDVYKYAYKKELDPQIIIKFDAEIEVAKYPYIVIKAKEASLTDETATDLFYNEQGSGATAARRLVSQRTASEDWQWIIYDATEADCDIGYLRFDPRGSGVVGAQGEFAGVFAFDTVEHANAFAESEEGKALGAGGGSEEIVIEKEPDVTLLYEDKTATTGWWINAPYREATIEIEFQATGWFQGFKMQVYAASSIETPFALTLYDDYGDEVAYAEVTAKGDSEYFYYFKNEDGSALKIQPGYYLLEIDTLPSEDDDLNDKMYIVLGSADAREDLEFEVEINAVGVNTNGNTKEVPAIGLIDCEAGEITTKAPTAEPTATPEVTEAPADEPTEAAEATEAAETAEATASGEETEEKSGCGGFVSCFAFALMGAALLIGKKKI